jgi:hypothetical protein
MNETNESRMSLTDALRLRGLTVKPIEYAYIRIGRNDYVVKSVFTGKNGITMSETLASIACNQAFNEINRNRKEASENEEYTEQRVQTRDLCAAV